MARRSKQYPQKEAFRRFFSLLEGSEGRLLNEPELRNRVRYLVEIRREVKDLGSSQFPREANSGIKRLLHYFRAYPKLLITSEETEVVGGIGDNARRIRELRGEQGWSIFSGSTINEMVSDDEFVTVQDFEPQNLSEISALKGSDFTDSEGEGKPLLPTDVYMLMELEPDLEAAARWQLKNQIRKSNMSVQDKVLALLRANVGKPVNLEELKYVANDKSEWARRVRELRTEEGWPVLTKQTGMENLKVGQYVLAEDRQKPPHDRNIADGVRRAVLMRDGNQCQRPSCGWTPILWNPSDPGFLEPHHIKPHKEEGRNTVENLITLCNVCHDEWHSRGNEGRDFEEWLRNSKPGEAN